MPQRFTHRKILAFFSAILAGRNLPLPTKQCLSKDFRNSTDLGYARRGALPADRPARCPAPAADRGDAAGGCDNPRVARPAAP